MGLTRNFIDRLISEGGRVGDFTIIPRQRFNGLEIHRTLNFHEIAVDDYAAYHIFLHNILNEIIDFFSVDGRRKRFYECFSAW